MAVTAIYSYRVYAIIASKYIAVHISFRGHHLQIKGSLLYVNSQRRWGGRGTELQCGWTSFVRVMRLNQHLLSASFFGPSAIAVSDIFVCGQKASVSLNPSVVQKSRNEKLKSDIEQMQNCAWKINLLSMEKQTRNASKTQAAPGKTPPTHNQRRKLVTYTQLSKIWK